MEPEPTQPPGNGHTISWSPKLVENVEVQLPEATGERFRIGAELARGGMGIVYRAHDLTLARDVAVKIMQDWAAENRALVSRFWDESRITAQLQHPGIPPVYEAGTTDAGAPFLAMKLINGETLATLLAARKDIAHERSRWLGVVEQVCQAVAYAHQHGVIHRDLKPQNVMVGAFGEVQVMDWGLAKVLRQHNQDAETLIRGREPAEANDTQLGDTVGTPAYMSPEQARGENDQLDSRTDVFSLGAILCVVLTGAPPYAGKNVTEVIERAKAGDVSNGLAKLQSQQLDSVLVALVTRCLAANSADRPANADEVAKQLASFRLQTEERLRAAEVESARTQVRIGEERKRRRVQLGLAGAVLLFVLGAAISGQVYQRMIADRKQLELKQVAELQQKELERQQLQEERQRETMLQNAKAEGSGRAAIAQANDLVQRALWEEATDSLKQAQRLLRESSDPQVQRDLEESLADVKLLAALDEINLSRFDANHFAVSFLGDSSTSVQYEAAFRERGWNVFEGVKSPAVTRIAQSPARNQFIEAIDAWAMGEPNPARRLQLLLAADQLTGQSWRSEFAVNWFLPARLQAMLDTVPADQQTSSFLAAVGRRLEETGGNGLAVLRAGCRKHPHSFFIHMRLAIFLEQPNRAMLDEAIGTYRAAVAIRPRCATAWIMLGNVMLKKDPKSTEALACIQEAVRVQPKHLPARGFLAIALAQLKDLAAAETACREALDLDPNFSLAHLTLSGVYQAQGRTDDAVAALTRGIELAPPNPFAISGFAKTLFEQKEYRLALIPARRAVQLAPTNAEYQLELGKILQMLKDPSAAGVLREATRLDPKKAWSWHYLRKALEDQNDLAGAIEVQQQVAKLEPNGVEHFVGLADLYLRARQPAGVITALETAVKLQPKNYDLQLRLGGTLLEQGQPARAIEPLRRCVELQPDGVWGVSNLIVCLCATGQGEEGLGIAQQTAERLPSQPWAQTCVGFALRSLGRNDEAQAQFEKVIALDPKYPGGYNDLAGLHLARGEYADAVRLFEKTLELAPGFSFARPNLGIALQKMGQLKKSAEQLDLATKESNAPWIASELARTRTLLEIESRAAKLRTGKEKFRNAADAFNALDYCRQPFCKDRQLHMMALVWLIISDFSSDQGNVLRREAARVSLDLAGDKATPAERVEPLRKAALKHLLDDIQAEPRTVTPEARSQLKKILNDWKDDKFFATFREQQLAELPSAEQEAWKSAWKELDAVLEKLNK